MSIFNHPFCELILKHHITPAFSLVTDLVTPRVIIKNFQIKIVKTLRAKKYLNLKTSFLKVNKCFKLKLLKSN